MPDDKNLRYRYPGTKPFEADEYELFKGRDGDVEALSELIALNNLVVLFGRSGLGKSSLLNAGLVNRFRSNPGLVPLFVRFGAYYGENTASPLHKLRDALTAQEEENASNFIYEKLIPKEAVAPHNLWYLFKSHQLAQPQQQSVVLIFDQFEELFTYPDAEVEAFKKGLSELLFVSVPQQLRNILKEELRVNAAYLTEEEKESLFRPLNVKSLFSIRSDKLSLLNGFTDRFPSVLNTCYELKPLSKEQARQAVEEPAMLDDKKYASPPFTFTADAVALLLKGLTEEKLAKDKTTGHRQDIETFQLQIVCRHAENTVMEKGLRQITAADLGDTKAIFENHYRNLLHKLPETQRLPAQRLMEEKLIIDGNRVSMPIPFILRDEGMTPALLDELINTHLLRREQNNTVEISHDTLVEPILKQYEERKKEEAVVRELRTKEEEIKKFKAEQERLLREQEQEAKMQRLKARRNKVLIAVISVALLFMTGLAGYAVNQSNSAKRERKLAEEQKSIAVNNEAEAKKEKENALSSQRKADSLRQLAANSDSSAKAALKEAERQQAIAENKSKEAEWQAAATRREKAEAERQKEAFRLILVAHEEEENDPTVALRIAEAAMNKFRNPLIVNEARHIYLKHDFYKTVGKAEDSPFGAFSPDGNKLLLSRYPGLSLLTNGYEPRKEIGISFEEDRTGKRIESVAFAPDGKRFLAGLQDGTIELWNTDSVRLREYNGHRRTVRSLAFSADGEKFISGSADSTAILWSLKGDVLMKFEGHQGAITSVALSRDNKKILTGSRDSTVRLWNVNDASFRVKKEGFPLTSLAFSDDETKVLTGSIGYAADNTVGTAGMWNLENDSTTLLVAKKVGMFTIAFAPGGKKILTGLDNGAVEIRNENGELLKEVKAHDSWASLVAVAPEGNAVLTSSNDDSAKLWDLTDLSIREFEAHKASVNLAAFSADGAKFFTGGDDRTAKLWNTNGVLLQTLKDSGAVSSVDLSGDGNLLLTASTDSTAKLWNGKGKWLHTYRGHTDAVQSVALSKDKTKVLTGSDDGTAVLWSINGDSLLTLKGHEYGVLAVAFSPDGTRLLTGSKDGTARLWNLKGELLHTLKEHKGIVYAVAFSQGGSRILTGAEDNTAILWNLEGKLLQRFKGHSGRVWSVAFAPDSTKIITGSTDGTVRVWNENGELLRITKGHKDAVSCAIFSPDGTKILTTSWDKTVKLWNSGRLLTLGEFLKSNAIDRLTPEQKQKFGIR